VADHKPVTTVGARTGDPAGELLPVESGMVSRQARASIAGHEVVVTA
jgi:hypothetical protein